MSIFGYQLWEIRQAYNEAGEKYEQLADIVRPDGLPLFNSPSIPDMNIDFTALKKINPDSTAWLYCPDTMIDYPVMKATDYDHYLHYMSDGTYSANGALFIDHNNAPDFSDDLTIIYGHNMKSSQMFGSLSGYKKQSYFEKHPYMYLYTEDGDYRVELIYGCVVGAGEWRDRAFMYERNLDSLMSYAEHNTTFKSDVRFMPGDKVVAMSTCSYEFNDARYVVIGVLRAA